MTETSNANELHRIQTLLTQRETDIANLKTRAKTFVGEMRAKEAKLKQQVLDLQAAAQTKDQEIYQYQQEKLQQQQQTTEQQSSGDSSSSAKTPNSIDTTSIETLKNQITVLKEEKLTLARDVETSKSEWCEEKEKVQQLEQDITQLLNAQQQSAEIMATANSRSRDRQVKLDQALQKIQQQEELVAQLKQEMNTQREETQEARGELDRITHQTSLQMGASSQVTKDLRSHVTAIEKERDALVTRLNQVRVATKDDTLLLESEVRDVTSKVKELQTQLAVDRGTFNQRREMAKVKFSELIQRAETAELELLTTKENHTKANNMTSDLNVNVQKLEIELKTIIGERDVLLHERTTQNNSQQDDRARLVETLERTETELKDQRGKRMVAKNEILSMVRQLDGQRDEMSELFGSLQKVVTRVGTYVISCRSAESKCNDTLTLLDVEMEIEVTVGGSGDVRVATTDGSDDVNDSEMKKISKKKKRRRNKSSRRTPRNPTDLVSVLEDELNVLGSIVDEVSKKIALLSGHLQHGGGRKNLELDGVGGVSGGGDGCVGYVKRLFGGSNQERTTVQRTSMGGKRRKNVRKYGKLGNDDGDDDVEE